MKKTFIIATIAMGLGLSSCDSYLDINEDPNSPAEANMTADILMPAAEVNLAYTYGGVLRIFTGFYVQYYGQMPGTSNYIDMTNFTMSTTRSQGSYTQLCDRVIKSAETVRTLSAEKEEWGSYLAGTVLRAFAYQVLVDAYGEIPYSEAQDISTPAPKYDNGQDIYTDLVATIDEALEKANPTDKVATNFTLGEGTAAGWIQFANALKLRLLMRESGVADVKSQLAALIAEDNFPTSDISIWGCWKNEQYQASPFYSAEYATWASQKNVVANVAVIGTMQQTDGDGNIVYSDPRLSAFFNGNSSGDYTGIVSGTNFSTATSEAWGKGDYWSRPAASYDMPVYLITMAETEFLLAEYEARYGSAASAKAHYEAAIEASCETAGVAGAADIIAKYPYDNANYKQVIGVQKWLALAGVNPFESWCEVRRLGYPSFGTVTAANLANDATHAYTPENYVPGYLYTPLHVYNEVGNNQILARFPYPLVSTSTNSNAPTFPGYTAPIFWAK